MSCAASGRNSKEFWAATERVAEAEKGLKKATLAITHAKKRLAIQEKEMREVNPEHELFSMNYWDIGPDKDPKPRPTLRTIHQCYRTRF